MGEKISIIVPIYNVEKYLNRCIESIVNQTYQNLEIILVDDGSPDQCPEICDQWALKDSRIKVVHKENGGLSDARNKGMEIASGDYIGFIDSDDWIKETMYELMLTFMKNNACDIVECDVSYVNEVGEKKSNSIKRCNKIYTRNEALKAVINADGLKSVVWNKLYKSEVLKPLTFKNGKLNEDEFFTFYVIDMCNYIGYISEALYYYLQRNSSIMGKYSLKRLDAIEAFDERLEYMKKYHKELVLDAKLVLYMNCLYHYHLVNGLTNNEEKEKGKKLLKKYLKKTRFSFREYMQCKMKDKIYIILSKISIEIVARLFCRAW